MRLRDRPRIGPTMVLLRASALVPDGISNSIVAKKKRKAARKSNLHKKATNILNAAKS